MMSVMGVDIGGANVKYAGGDGRTLAREFPMWRMPDKLAGTLAGDIAALGSPRSLAITMTGELADCFIDREVGVQHIVDSVEQAAKHLGIEDVLYYAARQGFLASVETRSNIDHVAASNWHALASYVGKSIGTDALLIDIGSTTTDLIPISTGQIATSAVTDHDRLREGTLVYVGCERTPVCALVSSVTVRGYRVAVMNELFATIDDARLVMGTAQPSADCGTADGRSRTSEFAKSRLARMVGLDRRGFTDDDAACVAEQVIDAAKCRISEAMCRVDQTPGHYILSGHGDDLLMPLDSANVIRLSQAWGAEVSRCAPAYAVAKLFSGELRV